MEKSTPVKPFVLPKHGVENLNHAAPKSLSASYFHPAFTGKEKFIKEFENLMDLALENPQKMTSEFQYRLSNLFRKTAEINSETFINNGADSEVYRYSDKYAFKIPIGETSFPDIEWIKIDERKLDINNQLDAYFGGEIGQMGYVSILKNADPQRIAIPIGAPFGFEKEEVRLKKYYLDNKCAQKVAALPQSAFDKIAMNFKKLNTIPPKYCITKYYNFDCINPNNFLIVGDEIKITDELWPTNHPNTVGGMLSAFITRINPHIPAEPDVLLTPDRKEIFKKCIIANEKAELPFLHEKDVDTLSTEFIENLEKAIKLAEIKTDFRSLIKKLKEFRQTFPDMDKRINAVEDYLDDLK